MDQEYEERVRSILVGREGWDSVYSTVSEFNHHLKEAALVLQGPVFWHHTSSQLQQKIIRLLENISGVDFGHHYLVQFWAAVKVEGRHHRLSTSNQPFCVSKVLHLGACWYRNVCTDIGAYDVDMEGAEGEPIGSVARAYKYKKSESTHDLNLYTATEFPLGNAAARCGFKSYMVLPLFDLPQDECCGVLEVFSAQHMMELSILFRFQASLKVGLS